MIKLECKTTKYLSKKDILNICLLKKKNWKYSINSQLNWFKNNIKKNDLHNLLFYNKKLIGYNSLNKRTLYINKIKKNYLLLDALILNKKFRKKKLSNLLMKLNNIIIKQTKVPSFLLCNNNLISFYKKFLWKNNYDNNVIKFVDTHVTQNIMCFNFSIKNIKNNINIFIHK
jgi:hypothetical protein